MTSYVTVDKTVTIEPTENVTVTIECNGNGGWNGGWNGDGDDKYSDNGKSNGKRNGNCNVTV